MGLRLVCYNYQDDKLLMLDDQVMMLMGLDEN